MNIINILNLFGATEQTSGIAALGIDPWAILAQAITFLVLFLIIKKFALNKIVTTLEKRRQTIEDGIKLGREMEEEKEQLKKKIEAQLHQARLEADKIIATAHEESGSIIKEAEVMASRKADAILADAHNRIDEDIQMARRSLEQEMREFVAEATEIILEEKLDASKDSKLLDRALKRLV